MNPVVIELVAQGGSQVTSTFNASTASSRRFGNSMRDVATQGAACSRAAQQAARVWASAWSPAIAAQKKFEAEEKAAAAASKQRAKDVAAAKRDAAKKAAADEKATAKAVENAFKAADRAQADSAKQAAKARADSAKQAAAAQKAAAKGLADSQKALDQAAEQMSRQAARRRAADARQAVAEARARAKAIADAQKPVNGPRSASAFNPYIAELKRAQAEQRRLEAEARRLPNALAAVRSAASTAWSAWRSGAANAGKATDDLVSKMRTLDSALGQVQFSGLQQGANQIRNVGLGVAAVGGAGMAGGWKAATDAGEVQKVKAGFLTSMDGDQARSDALFQQVVAFDEKSPMNLLESAKSAQTMLTMGFSDSEVPRVLTALGNMAASGGGDADSMNRAVIQLTQIKAKGKISAQDANALAEGGRIPVKQIFMEAFGKERTTEWMAGQERISDTEAIPAILEWIEKNRGKGMENALETLPGQIAQFNSQLFILSSTIGEDLMPVAKLGVAGLKMLVAVFNIIPAPIRKVLVFAGALIAGLLLLGGGLVALLAQGASAAIGMFGLALTLGIIPGAAGGAAVGLGGVATALTGALLPALMAFLGVLGVVALAIGVAALSLWVFKLYMEELSKPTSTVEDNRTSEQVTADDASKASVLKEVEDSKGADSVTRYAVLKAAQKKLGELGEADAALPLTREMNQLRGSVSEADRLNPTLSADASQRVARINGLAAGNKAARLSAVAQPAAPADPHAAQMSQIQSQMSQIQAGGVARPAGDRGGFLIDDAPEAPRGVGMSNLASAASGAPVVPGLGLSAGALDAAAGMSGAGGDSTDVDVLRERAMLSKDKGEKKKIRRQLFYALRQQRDFKASEREKRRIEREETREKKKEERETEKQRRLELRQRNTQRRYEAQAQMADLDTEYDVKIAMLQSQKQKGRGADNRSIMAQIARLRGEKAMRASQIRASGLSEENDLGREAEWRRGGAQAAKYAALAGIEANRELDDEDVSGGSGRGRKKASLGQILGRLRGGESIFDIARSKRFGPRAAVAYNDASTSGASGEGGESISQETKLTVRPKTRSFEQGGKVYLEILPEIIELPNSLGRALRLL